MEQAARDLQKDPGISEHSKHLLAGISKKLHFRDEMYLPGKAGFYLQTGLSAMQCIEQAIEAASVPEPQQILDLPCGHGRVLRFLKARFPQSEFTGADIDKSGLKFCKSEFGVKPYLSSDNLSAVQPGEFDLIWSGSLLTHLNQKAIAELLEVFNRSLKPGGLCVFTTHGEKVRERMDSMKVPYGLDKQTRVKLLETYSRKGLAYADYSNAQDYGVSIISPQELRKLANRYQWEEKLFLPAGWGNHQDVFAYQKGRGNGK